MPIQPLPPLRQLLRLTALAGLACLAACASVRAADPDGVLHSWVTSADGSRLLEPAQGGVFGRETPLTRVIDIDAAQRYQSFVGVGGAITDASAAVLTGSLSEERREALLQELFAPGTGLGLSFVRVTIGASDFSAHHYSLDDSPDGTPDPGLAHYSAAATEAPVLPLVLRARALNPALKVMASPWSAPAWMKDSGSLIRGRLRRDAYPAFADYLLRFADDYARAGIPLYALTMQNEPATEPATYPGMRFDAEDRARFIAEALGPRLAALPNAPLLLDWDHNWDAPDSPLAVLADPAAARYVAGIAWHCYGGKPAAQSVVHAAHPDKDTYLTECSGGDWSHDWRDALRFMSGTLLIDSMRHWARGVILWNIALDEHHGPHLGGCNNCRGVVTVDSSSGEVTRNVEYYVLGHVSRFVRPGAVRIDSTAEVDGLHTVAFQNLDDSSIALLIYNDGAAAEFTVRMAGRSVRYALAGGDLATLTWRPRR